MFVRISTVKRNGKVYKYAQLVESYRKNGNPTHRVVMSLKDWTPEAIDGLRLLLASRKDHKQLVLALKDDGPATCHAVRRTLEYLSIAVLDDCWTSCDLSGLLDELLPSSSIVSHGDMVRTLALHRCVAPGSKAAACRWYPTTALPELLGVKPRYYNNSRVHRALEALAEADTAVQERLGRRLSTLGGGVVACFLDLTDTWFVGRGPDLASSGRTKEGLLRQKIGIALLCDQRGIPLRWSVTEGASAEPPVMLDVLRDAVHGGIIDDQPVVMDRAMGRGAYLAELEEVGVSFVTAAVRGQYGTFVPEGPWKVFGDVEVGGSSRTRNRDIERLGRYASDAGMTSMDDGRFVLDLGVAACPLADERPCDGEKPIYADLLDEVQRMERWVSEGAAAAFTAFAHWYGVSHGTIVRYRSLSKLTPALQERLRSGDLEDLFLEEIQAISRLAPDQQADAVERELERVAALDRDRAKPPKILDLRRKSIFLRRVVWFSPELLLQRRQTARKQLTAVEQAIQALNESQRSRSNPRTETTMLADARVVLEKQHLLRMFKVRTRVRRQGGREHHEVVLTRDDAEWTRRRRLDGFGLVVAAPTIRRSGAEIVKLYFDKDVVEKDFSVIKSELELRPVHHRTDPKVQAHVTICMLALLLRRLLEARLREGGLRMTADAAHEALATCHLNELSAGGGESYFAVTDGTTEQRDITRALGLDRLLDTEAVRSTLTPR